MSESEYVRVIRLGAATITVINVGDIKANLTEWFSRAEHELPSRYTADFKQPIRLPTQCVYVQLPQTSVLVDVNTYELWSDTPFFLPGYQPPLGLLDRLVELGADPGRVNHVVITHTHSDHYNGVTKEHDGNYEPCFPNARHYVGRADWESADMQKALLDTNSLESHTLRILHRKGLLDSIAGNYSLSSEVQIIAAPGETPGHQIVRISSEQQTLYCLGDLYHHPIEVECPDWMWMAAGLPLAVTWANAAANQSSRRILTDSALAENALLVATHIRGIGRLEPTESGIIWKPI